MKNHALIFQVFGRPDEWSGRPLGGHRIASYLRNEHDWDIEVLDFFNQWTIEELQQYVDSRINSHTKFIGFSLLFSIWPDTAEQLCAYVKTKHPYIKILTGGAVHPQYKSNLIDFYVKGFGEKAVEILLQWLFGNGPRPVFMLLDAENRKVIDANDQYPAFPMRSLMIQYEDRDFITPEDTLGIEFSRGCKFSCAFCNFPVLGVKGDYSRDAEDAYRHLKEAYDRFGVWHYAIADETFNDDINKIRKFADVVERLPFTPWFDGFVRADLLSRPHDNEELARMNVRGQFYGIESFNHASAKAVGKGMHPDKVKQILLDTKKYMESVGTKNYRGTISLIIGLPHESIDSVLATKQWLFDNWQTESYHGFALELTADPGIKKSKISAEYEQYGYKLVSENTKNSYQGRDVARNGAKMSDHILEWENPYMTYNDAVALTDEFARQNLTNDFRCTNYHLSAFGHLNDINKILAVPRGVTVDHPDTYGAHLRPKIQEEMLRLLNQYKSKKLNWMS